ncbi:MAG: GH32 C-terminal domain-containing protein, partial [Lachnospiraceae bacterium]|nr:GH32 C-terminal domain-containing protein [Lachnospiraceae bacterium]
VGDPDRGILISWIGLPDNHYASAEEDWEGSMTLPRELRIRDGHLYQYPDPEVTGLREEEMAPERMLPAAGEMELLCDGDDLDLNLFTDADGNGGLTIRYDAASKTVTIDKSGLKLRFNEAIGEKLDMPLRTPLKKLSIFIDHCSVEIFANDGEETFTAHVYPTQEETGYTLAGNAKVKLWTYKASVKDDFVV